MCSRYPSAHLTPHKYYIWAIHHVSTFGCLLYPKERQQFWADQLGVRFLPFFNNGTQTSHQSVHGNLIYLNIHSLYIQI